MLSGDELYDDETTSGPIFHATAILPSREWMPDSPTYLALAETMHGGSDLCNANYAVPFAECGAREADIGDAIAVLIDLHKAGWKLVRDPGDTVELGL